MQDLIDLIKPYWIRKLLQTIQYNYKIVVALCTDANVKTEAYKKKPNSTGSIQN